MAASNYSATAAATAPLAYPCPRSPPKYPDMTGKHRELVKVQKLEREIGFLEEELKSVEHLQPASRSCKEVDNYVGANPDPLIPINRKINRSCRFWKWLCGKSCLNLSWICCCSCGCSFHCKTSSNCGLCPSKRKNRRCSSCCPDCSQPCCSGSCCRPSCCCNCSCLDKASCSKCCRCILPVKWCSDCCSCIRCTSCSCFKCSNPCRCFNCTNFCCNPCSCLF